MHTLRHARLLVRLVLAWYVLFVGVAAASPVFHPPALDSVCSATGTVKLLAKSDGGAGETAGHLADCPLCVQVAWPPASRQRDAQAPHPLSYALRPAVAAHLAALTGAPLPARGPPASA